MSANLDEIDMVSIGIYTPVEAARLIKLPKAKLQRWIKGYKYRLPKLPDSFYLRKEPLVPPTLPQLEGYTALTFLDLIELLFVKAFSERGVSLQYIRRAAAESSQIFETSHPFAFKRLYTDGKYIFIDLQEEHGHGGLLELVRGGQWVFHEIIQEYLEQIEFDTSTEIAIRWWPLGRSHPIVVDPKISFGAPIIESVGVPTAVVAEACLAEDSIDAVASWYELSVKQVKEALYFEETRMAA